MSLCSLCSLLIGTLILGRPCPYSCSAFLTKPSSCLVITLSRPQSFNDLTNQQVLRQKIDFPKKTGPCDDCKTPLADVQLISMFNLAESLEAPFCQRTTRWKFVTCNYIAQFKQVNQFSSDGGLSMNSMLISARV